MATTTIGSRISDVSYGGDPLDLDGSTYYWRIRFWDDADDVGDWNTTTASFSIKDTDLQDLTYTYDAVGNITQIIDASETDSYKIINFTYDDLYRLTRASTTEATTTDYLRTYTYNAIGNITNKSDQGAYLYQGDSGTSYANPHAVTSLAGTSYSYDNNGNLISDSVWTHSWDYNNRLVQSGSASATTTYAYDHTGQRVEYSDGVNTTYYPNRLYNIVSATTTKHIFANGMLIASIEDNSTASTTQWIHTDHLTGSNVITDEDGNMVQLLDYYPYGEQRINQKQGDFDEQRKFTGHEFDDETNLTYANARYYNQDIGRFLSRDPVSRDNPSQLLNDPQQLNTYSYSRNNPVVYVDKSGETSLYFALKAFNFFISHIPNVPSKIREANFVSSNPIAAYRIGPAIDGSSKNLSSVSSNFSVNLINKDMGYGSSQGLQGTERNAFRHVVWQSILTNEFGANVAREAGNSHEYNPFADLSVQSFSDKALADQSVDLLNNQIGRNIATENPGLTPQQVAQKALDYFHDSGLYTIQQDKLGMYNIVQTKISDNQYGNGTVAQLSF